MEKGIYLRNGHFSISYSTTIPRQVGLSGSSSIIIATLRALIEFYNIPVGFDRDLQSIVLVIMNMRKMRNIMNIMNILIIMNTMNTMNVMNIMNIMNIMNTINAMNITLMLVCIVLLVVRSFP